MQHMLISEGDSAGEIKLTEPRYLLGRHRTCDIQLSAGSPEANLSISRVHAFLTKIEDRIDGKLQQRWHITDGNPQTGKPSASGTYLWNESSGKWEKRKAAVLRHGDRIKFAEGVVYRYLCFDSSSAENGTEGATWV